MSVAGMYGDGKVSRYSIYREHFGRLYKGLSGEDVDLHSNGTVEVDFFNSYTWNYTGCWLYSR